MKKQDLNRSDLLEILYIISGPNIKLVNYNDWDRYLLGKDFAWIRDFATLCEDIMIWRDQEKKQLKELKEIYKKHKKKKPKRLKIKKYKEWKEKKVYFEKRIKNLEAIVWNANRIKEIQEHNFKFLVDVYLNLSNSTLSLGASGFDTLTKSRFEYFYPIEGNQGEQVQGGKMNFNLRK